MKKLLITFFIFLFCLTSSVGWSLEFKDLVKRDGRMYKKFNYFPFNGKITGQYRGTLKNGKEDGSWDLYYFNGQLESKGNFKNGKKEGSWVHYHENGQLESKGSFKNGNMEGSWVSYYYNNGKLNYKGNFKNHKKEGSWVRYFDNGQLKEKGDWKNGKEEGSWVYYNRYGTIYKRLTGTYKDGKRISD